MTSVLVLGAHGQIARVATKLFLEETDVELTLYLRGAERLDHLRGNNRVRIVEGDVLDREAVEAAMAGQDVVYANLSGDDARSPRPPESRRAHGVVNQDQRLRVGSRCISMTGIYDAPRHEGRTLQEHTMIVQDRYISVLDVVAIV